MYNDDKIADTTFGIGAQALAVLQILANTSPDFSDYEKGHYKVCFNTYPWYNGRERGIAITMNPNSFGGDKCLNIAIFEHRNSDQICCLKWETKYFYWNHPLEDPKIFDKAYKGKTKWDVAAEFGYLEIGKCVEWVYNQFEEFYAKNHNKAKIKS